MTTLPIGSSNGYLELLRKGSFRKSQSLSYTADEPRILSERPAVKNDVRPEEYQPSSQREDLSFRPSISVGSQWLTLDKQILHFYSFFYEGPVENRAEEVLRIRYCEIFFYLEDDTVMIVERKDDRSQSDCPGKLLKRSRVPKTNDPAMHLTIFDFNVNQPVTIFSRQYFIYKCDEFTQTALSQMGLDVPPDSEPPYSQHSVDSAAEQQLNHRLRRHISTHHSMGRFINYDTKVLRFYAYWDDRERVFGDRHFLVLHYYLGDQTLEILRKGLLAYGKERLEPFIKRSKMPKDALDYDKVNLGSPWPVLNIVMSNPKHPELSRVLYDQAQYDHLPEIITDKDLQCGITIPIMARSVYIYDCDEFTKWYYKETYGYEIQPITVDEKVIKFETPRKMPSYIGFGSEQDSLKSCLRLVPKPPLLDVRKYLLLDCDEQDPTTLIFNLKMVSDAQQDLGRRFIMSYYLNNDNIYIYEKEAPQGVTTGSFHSRKGVKKLNDPLTDLPAYLQPTDLYVGGVYLFHGKPFVITGTDETTAKFMEKYPQQYPYADPKKVLERVNQITVPSKNTISEELKFLDQDRSGTVEWDGFINILTKTMENILVPHEYMTLARHYQAHTLVSSDKLRELFRSIIQHNFRRASWDTTKSLMRAFVRADPYDTGYLTLMDAVRCAKSARAPTNMPIFTTYLDLNIVDPQKGVKYREIVDDLDWNRNPAKKLCDIPQTIGKDFDYSKLFGEIIPAVRYQQFLHDIGKG